MHLQKRVNKQGGNSNAKEGIRPFRPPTRPAGSWPGRGRYSCSFSTRRSRVSFWGGGGAGGGESHGAKWGRSQATRGLPTHSRPWVRQIPQSAGGRCWTDLPPLVQSTDCQGAVCTLRMKMAPDLQTERDQNAARGNPPPVDFLYFFWQRDDFEKQIALHASHLNH